MVASSSLGLEEKNKSTCGSWTHKHKYSFPQMERQVELTVEDFGGRDSLRYHD